MTRRLLGTAALAALAIGHLSATEAAKVPHPALERFLSLTGPAAVPYRALRRLDAQCEGLGKSAWMDVWTELDNRGALHYRIAAEGGSDYIRNKVFRASLDTEKKLWASGESDRAGITADNYVFEDRGSGAGSEGLAWLSIKPRRKAGLLIDGSIFLRPSDGELLKLEGRLVKSPSFWVRRVDIVRHYERLAGVRMPVALESSANLLIGGRSTLRMTYEYESVNQQQISSPQPRVEGSAPLQASLQP
ncbi:MAG: hypothetical protein ABI868_09865 [Acidobacteriota bacterium]